MESSTYQPDLAAAPSALWQPEHEGRLQCVQVRQETHDVKTFILAAESPRSFRYLPGQFITIELEIGGHQVNRCYTLSSTPTRPDLLSITVKRVPDGPVSNWLHDHFEVGMQLNAMGPFGDFSCFKHETVPRLLLISGGSGITPMMSMARAHHDLGSDADIVFIHCARSPSDVIFPDELALMARNMPQFRIAMVCEQHTPGSSYAGHLGRMDAARLAHIAPDFMERDVYTCGPVPFMAAMRDIFATAAYPMARYREESFSFDTPSQTVVAVATDMPKSGYKIELHKSKQGFTCVDDQTLLQAAQIAGVRMPSSCSNGVCGTCKTRMTSGYVEMSHNGGIRQREVDQGWILPCCSKPLSDVVLER